MKLCDIIDYDAADFIDVENDTHCSLKLILSSITDVLLSKRYRFINAQLCQKKRKKKKLTFELV